MKRPRPGTVDDGAADAQPDDVRRPLEAGLLVLLCVSAVSSRRAQAAGRVEDPDEIIAKTGSVPEEEPAAYSRPHARLKLSLEGFSIGTSWGMPVGLKGLHLEAYPLSRPWMRGGVGLTGGVGSATTEGVSASAVYGLFGVSVGTQYPARVTPFLEGHVAGGFMTATLDRPVTLGTVTVDNASGTTWLVVRGLDAGAEMYVFGRAYLSVSLGWMRSSWASPDFNPYAPPTTTKNVRITTVTADSLLWKVGLGI